jgi:hypothetical protein
MRRILSAVVVTAAALALGGSVMGAQATKPAKTHAAATAKGMSASGKIAKYDSATKTVTLTTAKGDESFVLGSDAKVMHAGKAVTDLTPLVGHSARVHYTEEGGTKTATSVSVAGMASAKTSKAKTEKPSGK